MKQVTNEVSALGITFFKPFNFFF